MAIKLTAAQLAMAHFVRPRAIAVFTTIRLRKFIGFLCGLALIVSLVGCSGTKVPPTVSVTGTVTYQSKAVEGAEVVFNSDDPAVKPAKGTTDAAGKFTLRTYVDPTTQANGAMPGTYKVTVVKIEKSTLSSEELMKAAASGNKDAAAPKNLLPVKYASPSTTDLPPAEIKKGTSATLTLELKD